MLNYNWNIEIYWLCINNSTFCEHLWKASSAIKSNKSVRVLYYLEVARQAVCLGLWCCTWIISGCGGVLIVLNSHDHSTRKYMGKRGVRKSCFLFKKKKHKKEKKLIKNNKKYKTRILLSMKVWMFVWYGRFGLVYFVYCWYHNCVVHFACLSLLSHHNNGIQRKAVHLSLYLYLLYMVVCM